MQIRIIENENTCEIVLTKMLDTNTSKEAAGVFLSAAEKYDDLTLNFKDTEYLSSAGIRALRDLYIDLHKKGGKIRLINVNENVMNVLDVTGLSAFFDIG